MSAAPKPEAFVDMSWINRAPSHQKPKLPPLGDLVQMLRDGETLEDLADTFERHPNTLRHLLNDAGWSATDGTPTANDDSAPAPLHKPYGYEPWMDDSLCSQADPEAFFPEKGGSTREAKAVCGRCLVAAECLDYALADPNLTGIWGGLSERERRKITAALNPDFPIESIQEEEPA